MPSYSGHPRSLTRSQCHIPGRFIRMIDVAHRSESQTHYPGPSGFQVFYRAYDYEFHRAYRYPRGTAHKVDAPSFAPIDWHKAHKAIYIVVPINGERVDLFVISMCIKATHAKSHLRATLACKPCA